MLETSASTRPSTLPGERWDLYRTLAEPLRLRLLALVAEEELAVGELAELLKESQPNVSRASTPLREASLVVARREGTRVFLRLAEEAAKDVVVADALTSGRALAEKDGSLARVKEVVEARDLAVRAYFDAPKTRDPEALERPAAELGAYIFSSSRHRHEVALDAGTGEGGLLDVLCPMYLRVIAVDRARAQLDVARARVAARGHRNVKFIEGDLGSAEVKKAVGHGVDTIYAVRLLHHAAKPALLVASMAKLLKKGGSIVALDYAKHEDEKMRDQGDLWLGFTPEELGAMARPAGLVVESFEAIPKELIPEGPDAHLPWQSIRFKNVG